MPGPFSFPPFVARAPWWGGDLQTLRNTFRGAVLPGPAGDHSERLELPLADGSGDRLAALLERPAAPRPGAPLVVVIHGLGGDETSVYVQVSTAHLLDRGFPVLRLNLRGAGPSRPLCRQQYHAGRSEDLRDVLRALPAAATPDGITVVGYSLGGNMLLKFLAEYGADVRGLRAAVAISSPIDLHRASRRIVEPRNHLYHRHLLAGMKREAFAAASVSPEERRIIGEVQSILDFDERLVAPRNGFAGADAYYAECRADRYLDAIPIDTLVIHALDDPWIPAESYTRHDWSRNPRLVPMLSPGGGHVGFHAADSRIPWHDRCLVGFLEHAAELAPGKHAA